MFIASSDIQSEKACESMLIRNVRLINENRDLKKQMRELSERVGAADTSLNLSSTASEVTEA